jgi:hypothetical protein
MIGSHDTAAAARTTVRIPTASGDEIEAWVYRPEGDGPHPAVVMAHGFAGIKPAASQRSRSDSAAKDSPPSRSTTVSGAAPQGHRATRPPYLVSARTTAP